MSTPRMGPGDISPFEGPKVLQAPKSSGSTVGSAKKGGSAPTQK